MRFGVLGSGVVGRTVAQGLVANGHDVMLGTRDVAATMARTEPDQPWQEAFPEWKAKNPDVRLGTFAETGADGETLVNATSGDVSLEVLRSVGEDNLAGKVLIDISNPLDFSGGFPPTLSVVNSDSLAEQIQTAFPELRVVKSLNTVTAAVMVQPSLVAGGAHTMFLCGDDAGAKEQVAGLLGEFGWTDVIDLGDIACARGMEMYLPLWLRLMGVLETPMFNISVVR